MSERNVELMRRVYEVFNERDVEAYIAYCDPSIEFNSALAGGVSGAGYRGHDGVRQFLRDLDDAWREFRLEPKA